ncbi:hypothetical protein [Pseudomonas syringae]|uniref:hypothetical protein n=1 Tax=Pseudomonas syringae TaxID=317 RepID=UPI0018E651FC|nr:hypothetical protein [Pseudomonas syringae]MBI6741711.1 hypothetical protein [Pseudomonas syringae]MBI6748665.1 hypothetical protein [Pseudomonas syringae]MBI6762311.1 hypothetical protein [Pseudomonas syringae]MBI6768287.1 hypothetical protein [Pseudomonas syringae]MBI6788146.1 hypothetical protein [Pseudomonas syringae]
MDSGDYAMFFDMYILAWTVAGLIYPPAAGLKVGSRLTILAVSGILILSSQFLYHKFGRALTLVEYGAEDDIGITQEILTFIWIITVIAWPSLAFVLRYRSVGSNKA